MYFSSARVKDVISVYSSRSQFKPWGNSGKSKAISEALSRAIQFFGEGRNIDIQSFLTYRENGKPSIKDTLEIKRYFGKSNAYEKHSLGIRRSFYCYLNVAKTLVASN